MQNLQPRFSFSVLTIAVLPFLTTAPADSQQVQVTDSSPPEAKLAAIEHNSRTLSPSTIRPYGAFLDGLEAHCRQSRMFLSDMVLEGRKQLRSNYGKDMSILRFGQAAARMMRESGLSDADCTGTIALLVTTLGGEG